MAAWEARSWMMFVDGENLTIRGEEFSKKHNFQLTKGSYYEPETFLWMANQRPLALPPHTVVPEPRALQLSETAKRSYYYTSVTGSEEDVDKAKELLWRMGFTPKVFRKFKNERRSKGVDIALTKDVLSHAFRDHFEVAVIVAGDQDYLPLVEEVKSLGKLVYVWFFSKKEDGLSPKLKLAADCYIRLDEQFQRDWMGLPR
jgi:uncharacterized LabA/DUF88 family protein